MTGALQALLRRQEGAAELRRALMAMQPAYTTELSNSAATQTFRLNFLYPEIQ